MLCSAAHLNRKSHPLTTLTAGLKYKVLRRQLSSKLPSYLETLLHSCYLKTLKVLKTFKTFSSQLSAHDSALSSTPVYFYT